jgi:tyrosinase
MIGRRTLLGFAATGVAAPFILSSTSRAAPPRVRRDVMEFADNDPFFQKYATAVRAMHALPQSDRRSWIRQADIHADFCKHGVLSFLHWHRHYLAFFEAICGELIGDPDFALPYWNWSKKSGVLPVPFYDIQELNVEYWNDPGQYNGQAWGAIDTVGRRGLAKGQGLLNDPVRGGSFTSTAIDGIKTSPNATLFRGRLEGSPHNNGHVIAGATAIGKKGHIGDGLSPLDPIFWLHHCMVDRLWAEWQKTHSTPDPGESYDMDFVDRKGMPAPVKSGGAQSIAPLEYTYDVLEVLPASGAAPAAGNLLNAIIPELNKALLQPSPPTTLGTADNAEISFPRVETAIHVSTPNLAEALTRERAFTRFALGRETVGVEKSRTLAQLSDVRLVTGSPGDLIVNVFVDCPYLSPSTGYVDPHYAGTFSFFGAPGHAEHGGRGNDFVIDITAPVRALAGEGRIKMEQLTIQLMPLPAYMNGTSDASLRAGKVDIISF